MIPQLSVGDYLKTKRAMIRAVEKQALLSEKIDLLKEALAEGGVTSVASEGAQPKSVPSPGKCFSRNASLPFILAGYPTPSSEAPQTAATSFDKQCRVAGLQHAHLLHVLQGAAQPAWHQPRQALVTRHRHKVHFCGLFHSCLLSML